MRPNSTIHPTRLVPTYGIHTLNRILVKPACTPNTRKRYKGTWISIHTLKPDGMRKISINPYKYCTFRAEKQKKGAGLEPFGKPKKGTRPAQPAQHRQDHAAFRNKSCNRRIFSNRKSHHDHVAPSPISTLTTGNDEKPSLRNTAANSSSTTISENETPAFSNRDFVTAHLWHGTSFGV